MGKKWGKPVYKVTIYECMKFPVKFGPFLRLFQKRGIDEYVVPFYFETKELAQDYIKYSDKVWFRPLSGGLGYEYELFLTNYKQRYSYSLVSAVESWSADEKEETLLNSGGVWNGKVNLDSDRHPYKIQSIYFTDVFEKEEKAAKEGTIGQTFSYKLQTI